MSVNRPALIILLIVVMVFGKGCSPQNGKKDNPSGPDLAVFETGTASWYGEDFQGRRTASGEIFDLNQLTAAHKTLPFGSVVEVTNLANGRQITVKVNDRGPYQKDRIIDLSKRAAVELGMMESGTAKVSLRIAANS